VEQLMANIRSIDARIEKRVSRAVDILKPIGDSKDTGTRVARTKAEAIDFLRKQISDYSRRRMQLRAELDNPRRVVPEEALTGDIGKIDARIDRRIEQVVILGGSFAAHQDYEKYTVTGSNWSGGTVYGVSEDYRQNQRNTRKTDEQKGKIFNAIDETVKRLEFSNRSLQSRLATATPASAKRMQADIARNETLINTLEGKRAGLLSPNPDQLRLIGLKEAMDIETRCKAGANDIRNDQIKMINLYNECNTERARLQSLTAMLAATRKATGGT
jgi:hypothetical protein